jgi:hypothetical protein
MHSGTSGAISLGLAAAFAVGILSPHGDTWSMAFASFFVGLLVFWGVRDLKS